MGPYQGAAWRRALQEAGVHYLKGGGPSGDALLQALLPRIARGRGEVHLPRHPEYPVQVLQEMAEGPVTRC
eukprot:11183225-Lingulodinium_polyedra.AAC.1